MTRNRTVRRAVAAVLMASALVVGSSGCWGKRELEERSFVTLMGVDIGQTGQLLVTLEIAIPRAAGAKMGGGGGGGGGNQSALVLSGEGRDILEAIDKIEVVNSRDLTTTHMSFVILGEEFAKSDVSPVIDLFSRNLEFRHNTLIAVCQGRAVDFMNEFSSLEESEPSQYISKLVTTSSSTLGVCPVVTMHEFMVGYNVIAIEPWAPYLALASVVPAERSQGEQAGKSPISAGGAGDTGGGGAASQAKPKAVRILGTAVFRRVERTQRMVGYLDNEESMAAMLLSGILESGYLDVANPGDQAETTLHIHHESTRTKLTLRGSAAEAEFTVTMTMSVDESQVGIEMDEADQEYRKALVYTAQDQMTALLSRTFLKLADLGSDVVGLGHLAEGKFGTYQEWEAYDWRSVFPRTEATFEVKAHVLTAGFTIRRPYPE